MPLTQRERTTVLDLSEQTEAFRSTLERAIAELTALAISDPGNASLAKIRAETASLFAQLGIYQDSLLQETKKTNLKQVT